jgi:proline iminopeptidase
MSLDQPPVCPGERQPDEIFRVPVDGYEVIAYSFGSGEEVLFCLNGGPGLPSDYLRDSHSRLADFGYRVVIHDQLGTGASDRPDDPFLWTIDRYAKEVETVRAALGLGRVHLLGQSWGTALGTEYVLIHPDRVKTFTIANGTIDTPLHISELHRLRGALGPETVQMMLRHEADGTTEHPEYAAAITILNYRHLCRLQEWPAPLQRSLAGLNRQVYATLWGLNEFTCTGTRRFWNRLGDLHRVQQPCLVLVGLHDESTPAVAASIAGKLPRASVKVLPNSSHMPFFEEPQLYFAELRRFLDAHRGP